MTAVTVTITPPVNPKRCPCSTGSHGKLTIYVLAAPGHWLPQQYDTTTGAEHVAGFVMRGPLAVQLVRSCRLELACFTSLADAMRAPAPVDARLFSVRSSVPCHNVAAGPLHRSAAPTDLWACVVEVTREAPRGDAA